MDNGAARREPIGPLVRGGNTTNQQRRACTYEARCKHPLGADTNLRMSRVFSEQQLCALREGSSCLRAPFLQIEGSAFFFSLPSVLDGTSLVKNAVVQLRFLLVKDDLGRKA